MNNKKYRITIENIGEGADFEQNDNIRECDGFVLLGYSDDGHAYTVTHDVTPLHITASMIAEKNLMMCAMLAVDFLKHQNSKSGGKDDE